MFYHREKELALLDGFFKKSNHALLIYGKKEVGKTSLIMRAEKHGRRFIYFECYRDTMEENVRRFVSTFSLGGIEVPAYVKFSSFLEAFAYLDSLNIPLAVAIDEYPYLKEFSNGKKVDGLFQNIIDNHLKNISLVLSGSQIRVMEEILSEGNPLYGRFSSTLYLEELNYLEASSFYPDKSVREKIAFYGVYGGSPFINERIDPSKTLKENIVNTYLSLGDAVYNYADSLLLSDAINANQARRVLDFLGNGKKYHKEIMEALDPQKTGIANRSLSSLLQLKLIRKSYPINKKDDSKKATYEIEDNVLRFYFAYVYRNKSQLERLGPDVFYDTYIAPSILTYISYRFEEICRDYFSLVVKAKLRTGIRDIGTYYYDDKSRKKNGEFDIALELENGYAIYEAKYHERPIGVDVIRKEESQIRDIKDIGVTRIGFISSSGFEKKVGDFDYIDGEDLYRF